MAQVEATAIFGLSLLLRSPVLVPGGEETKLQPTRFRNAKKEQMAEDFGALEHA